MLRKFFERLATTLSFNCRGQDERGGFKVGDRFSSRLSVIHSSLQINDVNDARSRFMKLSCPKSALSAAFQTVAAVVPSRTPKEVLKNIKLILSADGATLVGTDQEIGVRSQLADVESGSAGELLLPTQRFGQILREVPDDAIQIEVDQEALFVRAGSSEFRLSTEDPDQFPEVASYEDQPCVTLPGKVLKTAIQRSIFAVSQESTRYALGGVQVELMGDKMVLAATDGRRLAVVEVPCETTGELPDRVVGIIPQKAMQLIDRSIADPDEPVKIALNDNEVLAQVGAGGHTTVYARLVDGSFPDYNRVIPSEYTKTLDVVVGPLYQAVRQAQIVTSDESRGVNFEFNDGTLTLTSSAADVGNSTIQLPIDYAHEGMTITFDPRFLVEFLRVLGAEDTVQIRLNDSDKAGVFVADGGYTYVVMPLQRDR